MRRFIAVLALGACSSTPSQPDVVTFPAAFMWGTSTAAFQVEAMDVSTDWSVWAMTPGKIKNGDMPDPNGPDALNHVDADIASMQGMHNNAYRFSIEWGRIYPTLSDFDNDTPDMTAITAYTTELSKLQAAGITPMVTLHHFAFPSWLDDVTQPQSPQGWERTGVIDQFSTFCGRMAKRFGSQVDWWITINEPLNLVLGGYVQGSFPPGVVLDTQRAITVAEVEARAHAACYDAIHQNDSKAMVSYAAHLRTFHPLDPTSMDDQTAADHVKYLFNDWFLNAVILGNWDANFDGSYTEMGDMMADPTLKGRADFIGVNYYSDTLISADRGIVLGPPVSAAVYEANLPTTRPKTDFGWDIYPDGFGTVLDEVKTYALPVVITENGVADQGDVMRARFIAEHLYQLGWAIQRGLDVRGYFHWALVDNFEWASGFCPHFGLSSYDITTKARTLRGSAQTYASIIQAGMVKLSDIDAMPPYGAPTAQCQ